MKKLLLLLGFAGALAALGCSSSDTDKPDGGKPDGGEGGSAPDGGSPDGGPPVAKHNATTRTLLGGTSTKNLLLDPFVTTDLSLEHFIPLTTHGLDIESFRLPRQILSQAPAGVAFPVAVIPLVGSVGSGIEKLQIIAPIPGSASITASVWVAAIEGDKPVGFSTAAADLVVVLLPNDQPTKSFPLAPIGKPVTLGQTSWVKLELKGATAFSEGGWFSISTTSNKFTFKVQAPEVVPMESAAENVVPDSVARNTGDALAVAKYAEIVHRPKPQR
jgi:hypothetical protein